MGVSISQRGSFSKTYNFLRKTKIGGALFRRRLEKYGQMGVDALRQATPKRTGKTADSWSYEIHETKDSVSIVWTNSNNNKWANVAVLIQYGHATRSGGYVEGIDYINPAMKPVFEKIADGIWGEVVSNE